MSWPWPWPCDLGIYTWPKYCSNLPTYQNEVNTSVSSKVIIIWKRQTDRQTFVKPLPARSKSSILNPVCFVFLLMGITWSSPQSFRVSLFGTSSWPNFYLLRLKRYVCALCYWTPKAKRSCSFQLYCLCVKVSFFNTKQEFWSLKSEKIKVYIRKRKIHVASEFRKHFRVTLHLQRSLCCRAEWHYLDLLAIEDRSAHLMRCMDKICKLIVY